MTTPVRFPRLRWVALAWLLVWIPVYHDAYGTWHFLQLCNLGLLTGAAGLLLGSPLLLSAQAVATCVLALVWLADAGLRLLTGDFLHGGTAYLWDPAIPLAARMLSVYHVGFPLLLLYCLARTGYDRRGFALQCVIAAAAIAVGLWLAPVAENLNYVFRWPGAGIDHAHPVLRSLTAWWAMVVLFYLPAHLLLRALLPTPAHRVAAPTGDRTAPTPG